MLTTEPELRLYSTPKLLVVTWYSCTQSVLPMKKTGAGNGVVVVVRPVDLLIVVPSADSIRAEAHAISI